MAGLSIRFRVTNRLALFCDVSSQKRKKGGVLEPTVVITYAILFKLKMGAFDCKANSTPAASPPPPTSLHTTSSCPAFLILTPKEVLMHEDERS